MAQNIPGTGDLPDPPGGQGKATRSTSPTLEPLNSLKFQPIDQVYRDLAQLRGEVAALMEYASNILHDDAQWEGLGDSRELQLKRGDRRYFSRVYKNLKSRIDQLPENLDAMPRLKDAVAALKPCPMLTPRHAPDRCSRREFERMIDRLGGLRHALHFAVVQREFAGDGHARRDLAMLRTKVHGLIPVLRDLEEAPGRLPGEVPYLCKSVADIEAILRRLPPDREVTCQIVDLWERWQGPPRRMHRIPVTCPRLVQQLTKPTCPRMRRKLSRGKYNADEDQIKHLIANLQQISYWCSEIVDYLPAPLDSGGPLEDPIAIHNLRLLRVGVEDLREHVVAIREGKVMLRESNDRIDDLVRELDPFAAYLPTEYETPLRVRNRWENVKATWKHARATSGNLPETPTKGDTRQAETDPAKVNGKGPHTMHAEMLEALTQIDADCEVMMCELAFVTVPPRVNDWLDDLRVGQTLPFHDVFKDELPNDEARQEVLEYLSWSPQKVKHGVVDPTKGDIYRTARTEPRNWVITGLVAMGFAMTFGLLNFESPIGWVPQESGAPGTPASLWMLILGGIATHVLLDAYRRSQTQGGRHLVPGPTMIGRWVTGHVMPIATKWALSIFLLFVGTVMLGDAFDAWGAFLLGFGLDSVVATLHEALEARSGNVHRTAGGGGLEPVPG